MQLWRAELQRMDVLRGQMYCKLYCHVYCSICGKQRCPPLRE